MTRTVDDVIAEWKAYLAGIAYLQREAGPPNPDREPTDRELILAEIARLRAEVAQQAAEIADLKVSVIVFGAPAMVECAKDHGLPDHHLYAHHYDILAKAGARMVAFKRWEEAADA